MKHNVLIIGAGGREHALAWKLAQSSHVDKLFVAPGNGGTSAIATNVALPATDIPGLVEFAQANDIYLTVVGPDDILAAGAVDAFQSAGLLVYGPSRAAAQLESSKAFAKDVMDRAGVPTAAYQTFTDTAAARAYAAAAKYPLVVKASGLALGKGVVIAQTRAEAEEAIDACMEAKVFGEAGATVVIEEFLDGTEVSLHAFCDGTTAVPFPVSQDHKAIFDGDEGPNTGGMGTIAPVPWAPQRLIDESLRGIIQPVLATLKSVGTPFRGTLYPGLMLTAAGPRVLEFNARFGDPETQSYMRLLKSDLFEILEACARGRLADVSVEWTGDTAVTVILASEGYPGRYPKGRPITGIDAANALPGVVVFHAGTVREGDETLTAGGRVLAVSAVGDSLEAARARAYAAVEQITFDGMQYRRDIGKRATPSWFN